MFQFRQEPTDQWVICQSVTEIVPSQSNTLQVTNMCANTVQMQAQIHYAKE